MKWNPDDYGNLSILHVSEHEVWKPDVSLYNSATGNGMDIFGYTNCLVYSNGSILWVPPTLFKSHCEFDMHYWPYDRHTCMLDIGSWTFNALQLDFADNRIAGEMFLSNHEFKVTSVSSKRNVKMYACCEEPYVDVEFSIKFERRSPMYKAVILAPALVVIVMTLANFWLPAQSGEKILLNGINIVIVVSFLVFFAQRIPALASCTPLVGE